MSGFPKPPQYNRVAPDSRVTPPPVGPSPPPPEIPAMTVNNGKAGETLLTDAEVSYILKENLRADQYEDPRVLKFIMSYLQCRNVSQAGREAGFVHASNAYQLRNRPEVHRAIQALTEKSVMKYGYDSSEIIERVKEIAALDPVEFENPDGSFKTHLSQINPESRRAIKKFTAKNIYGKDPNGMQIVIGQLISVELWDKMKGLELLGREVNIFKETKVLQHDVTANMANILLDSKKRADQRVIESARPVEDVTAGEAMEILEIEGKVEDVGI